MARTGLRPPALDVLLGLSVGVTAVAAARMAGTFGALAAGPDFGPPGPWGRHGHAPGPVPVDLQRPLTEPYTWAAVLWAATVLLGVVFRRVRPRTGYVVTVLGATGYLAAGLPFGPVLAGPVLGLAALAGRTAIRDWLPWSGLLAPLLWAGFVSEPYLGLTDPGYYSTLVLLGAAMVMPALFVTLRRNRVDADRRNRELELRRATYSERLRIARDVHDLIGHSLSVITMQAGVALYVLEKRGPTGGLPETDRQVAESLQAIRSTSKGALEELRVTLGVFRGETDPGRTPPAGLDRVPELVEAMRSAGRQVRLIMADVGVLPGPVDNAAYRVVQEALTNVARHAGRATATVTIRRGGNVVIIDVSDDGTARPRVGVSRSDAAGSAAGSARSGGSGLIGMAERAASVGGTVTAGPRPEGGFVVHAEFPIMVADGARS